MNKINSANNRDESLLRFLVVYAIILVLIIFAWGYHSENVISEYRYRARPERYYGWFVITPAKHKDQYYVISFALAFVLTLGGTRAWDELQRRRVAK
jgi:hypothetical protein